MTLTADPAVLADRKRLVEASVLEHSAHVLRRFDGEARRRYKLLAKCQESAEARVIVLALAKVDPIQWMNDWVWLYEPRNPGRGLPSLLPLTLRPRQADYVRWLQDLRARQQNGLTEKSRDEGMTWIVIGYYVNRWLFEDGFSGGLGSRKLDLVDKLGDLDTLFEKARHILRNLPKWMRPTGYRERDHSKQALLLNPANGNTIKGEGGDNIGRGGRSSMYFVDEFSKVPRADSVHAALSQNTDVIIYGGTPHGRNNLFARIAKGLVAGETWPVFTFHWRDNPDKNWLLEVPALNGTGTDQVHPWYLFQRGKAVDLPLFEQEVDISYDAETKRQVILGAWVQAALQLPLTRSGPKVGGLDVGETGDATVYAGREGPVATRIQTLDSRYADVEAHDLATRDRIDALHYDRLGVGAGITMTMARSNTLAYSILGIANSESPSDTIYEDNAAPARERFALYNAEMWWRLRLRFQKTWERVEQGIPHPDDECISLAELKPGDDLNALISQLSQPVYNRVGTSGKLRVDKLGEAGGKSPNHAEALMYAFAIPDADTANPISILAALAAGANASRKG